MSSRRPVLARFHAAAGMLALAITAVFMVSSILAELFGEASVIATVKQAIVWALLLLVPALAATGGSGFFLTGGKPGGLAARKLGRMKVVALNGLLVLVPSALFLAWKADGYAFDAWFAAVQAVEFAAGGVNIALMALNARDGLRMSGRRGRSSASAAG